MIIKHVDGTEIDTDKLPDIDAQIFEKTEELRKLCESANRIFLLQIDTKGGQRLTSFWNYKSGTEINEEMLSMAFAKIAKATHNYFMSCSNGNIGLYPTHAVDIDKLNNNNNDE
jgi:hypothetical protein